MGGFDGRDEMDIMDDKMANEMNEKRKSQGGVSKPPDGVDGMRSLGGRTRIGGRGGLNKPVKPPADEK